MMVMVIKSMKSFEQLKFFVFAAQDSRDFVFYCFLIFVILKNEIPRRRRRRRRRPTPPPPQEGKVGPKLPRMLFSIGVIGDGDDDDDDDDDDENHDDLDHESDEIYHRCAG